MEEINLSYPIVISMENDKVLVLCRFIANGVYGGFVQEFIFTPFVSSGTFLCEYLVNKYGFSYDEFGAGCRRNNMLYEEVKDVVEDVKKNIGQVIESGANKLEEWYKLGFKL